MSELGFDDHCQTILKDGLEENNEETFDKNAEMKNFVQNKRKRPKKKFIAENEEELRKAQEEMFRSSKEQFDQKSKEALAESIIEKAALKAELRNEKSDSDIDFDNI